MRMRGIQRWPTTVATITSIAREGKHGRGTRIQITFVYRTEDGQTHIQRFTPARHSSSRNVSLGAKFTLHYHPKRPKHYWNRERELRVHRRLLAIGGAMAIGLLVVMLFT